MGKLPVFRIVLAGITAFAIAWMLGAALLGIWPFGK